MMSAYQIIQKVERLYVYYPVQGQWYKAGGGPQVDSSEVGRVCSICPDDLGRYERIQSDGVDRNRPVFEGGCQ